MESTNFIDNFIISIKEEIFKNLSFSNSKYLRESLFDFYFIQ